MLFKYKNTSLLDLKTSENQVHEKRIFKLIFFQVHQVINYYHYYHGNSFSFN